MSATPTLVAAKTPPSIMSLLAALRREGTRRFPGQRLLLGLVLVLAAFLDFFQISQEGWSNDYYAAAVRSMLQGWHNFFFVSLDPGGFVTIDKPPLGFWIETASAKLFGYNGISLIAPQALADVLAVAILYHLVSRAFGFPAGLIAALALAVTPISVVGARSNNIDSQLVLMVLLTAWATLKAAETGRLRWLLLGAVLLGLGFNIKTMQAYLVLPACALVYACASPRPIMVRAGHLALAAVVLLVVSFSWITAVDLTPASARPYVGSSCTNSELNLALGYNGLARLTGGLFRTCTASETASQSATTTSETPSITPPSGGPANGGPGGGGPGGFGENGAAGPFRLLDQQLGGQIGWLLPLAVVGLLAAALELWRGGEDERGRAGRLLGRRGQSLVLWGVWLATQVAFFSMAGFFHAYYLVMLSPAIAALSGIGIAALWSCFRRGGWRLVLLPLALAGTAAVQVHILVPYPAWNRWLVPLILGAVFAAVTLLVCSRLPLRRATGVALGGATIGVLALLAAPATWAAYTMQHGTGGGLGQAGPSPQRNFAGRGGFGGFGGPGGFPGANGGPGGFGQGGPPPGGAGAGFGAGGPGAGGPGLGGPDPGVPLGSTGTQRDRNRGGFGGNRGTQVNQQLLSYLERHQGTATYLVAVESSMNADPYIITTGKAVMALGGFNGSDKILSVAQLAQLVKAGTVRYFLLSGVDRSLAVSSTPLSGQSTSTRVGGRRGFFGGGFGGPGGSVNADLTAWVGRHCAAVPASAYSSAQGSFTFGGPGGFGGTQLYDCAATPSPSSQAG